MNLPNHKDLLTQAAGMIENLLTQVGATPSDTDLAFLQALRDAAASAQTLIFARESTTIPNATRSQVLAMLEGAVPMLRKPTITPHGEGVDYMNLYWRLAQALRFVDQQIDADAACASYLRASQGELVMVAPPPEPVPEEPPTDSPTPTPTPETPPVEFVS